MAGERKWVRPDNLYPVATIESIDPLVLNKVKECVRNGEKLSPIKVICYDGYYFILEGNYEMLAANIMRQPEIEIEILNRLELDFWNKDENIKEQLKIVGMNTLHDFEGIGGFIYAKYPELYKREV